MPSSSRSADVHVDRRWAGQHGIGRYAHEVISRLGVDWQPLDLEGDPASLRGLTATAPSLARHGLVYSPGYNVVLGARRQLVTVHDLIHLNVRGPSRLKYRAYYESVLRPRLRRDRTVITVSETSRAALAAWLRDDRITIVNAGNGCSSAFSPQGEIASAAAPYVLYVGNLRAHKNVDVLFDALTLCPSVHLQLVVPPNAAAEARQRAGIRGIGDRVIVRDGVDDSELATLYRGAAATIMPSLYEGFGLPAVESICCGTPVVFWAGCAAVAETVGERGIAVAEPTLAAAWADAIRSLVSSHRRVTPPHPDQFSWDRTAARVSDTLRSMTDGAPWAA